MRSSIFDFLKQSTIASETVVDAPPADAATCLMHSTSIDTAPLAIASMSNYPGSTLQPSPTGEVAVTETFQMSTSSFSKYKDYAGTALMVAPSKVWVSQVSRNKVRVSYTMKTTGIADGRYGVHVHVGTTCEEVAGAHMWQPATASDPWAAGKFSKANAVPQNVVCNY